MLLPLPYKTGYGEHGKLQHGREYYTALSISILLTFLHQFGELAFSIWRRVSTIDCTTAQIEMARKQCGKRQRYNSAYTALYICIWAYTFENSHWILSEYLSFSYLSPTLVQKIFSQKSKELPIKLASCSLFFVFRIVAIYIHFEIVLFIFLAEKGTHRLTKVTVCETWPKFIVWFISGCFFSYWLNSYKILRSVTHLASQLDFFSIFFSTLHML